MNCLTITHLADSATSSRCGVAFTVWSRPARQPVRLPLCNHSPMVPSLTTPVSASVAAIAFGRAHGVCPRRNGIPTLQRYSSVPTVPTALTSLCRLLATDSHLVWTRRNDTRRVFPLQLASKPARLIACASERATRCSRRRAIAFLAILRSM